MKLRYQNSYSSDVGEFAVKKRTKKKINSILAIFMSLAIIASGFGTPMAGLVAAAGENSAQQTEKTVEKTSVEKAPAPKIGRASCRERV